MLLFHGEGGGVSYTQPDAALGLQKDYVSILFWGFVEKKMSCKFGVRLYSGVCNWEFISQTGSLDFEWSFWRRMNTADWQNAMDKNGVSKDVSRKWISTD